MARQEDRGYLLLLRHDTDDEDVHDNHLATQLSHKKEPNTTKTVSLSRRKTVDVGRCAIGEGRLDQLREVP